MGQNMRYAPEQIKEMAQAFIGMYDAGVEIRVHAVLDLLAFFFQTTPAQALANIRQLALTGEL
jgi:hypothetical protein